MNILVLDVETTGVDIGTDRIIELACRGLNYDVPAFSLRFNPGRPIPEEATAVHGISDDDVRHLPSFADSVEQFWSTINGADIIAGYNVGFDVGMLAEELSLAGYAWPRPGALVLDAYKVMAAQYPRNLSAAYRTYVGEPDAERLHTADYDTQITTEVILAQLAIDGREPHELAIAMGGNIVDPAGKIVRDDQGQAVFAFGKNQGKPVASQPGYAQWMLSQDFPSTTKRTIQRIMSGEIQ
jgi:DNA polymerase-3 subunit epsilon